MSHCQFFHLQDSLIELALVHELLFQVAAGLDGSPDIVEEHLFANGKVLQAGVG